MSMQERCRLCVSCRSLQPVHTLFCVTYSRQQDAFAVNGKPAFQGRSAYVCRKADCLQTALKGKKLQRALKRAIPDDILRYLNEEWEGLKTEWHQQK